MKKVASMIIRYATDDDCHAIYTLHVDSIKFYCSPFYSENAITAWVKLKSPDEYKCNQLDKIVVVAEKEAQILGFGQLDLNKKCVTSLYMRPTMTGKGIGKLILEKIEHIAQNNGINELKLNSTLNAVTFYHHMGYGEDIKTIFTLSSGVNLDCVEMRKSLNPVN